MPIILGVVLLIIGILIKTISQSELSGVQTAQSMYDTSPTGDWEVVETIPSPTPFDPIAEGATPAQSSEEKEINDYMQKISSYAKEYVDWYKKLLKISDSVRNGTFIGSLTESQAISSGFSDISMSLSLIQPPNIAINMHNHFIQAADNASTAANAAYLAIGKWQTNQFEAEIQLNILGQYLKLARDEFLAMVEESKKVQGGITANIE